MTNYLSDETWRMLDPYAGQLSRRQAARLWSVVLVALLLAGAGVLSVRSGLLIPRIGPGSAWMTGVDAEQRTFYLGFEIVNNGSFTIEVTGAGGTVPGAERAPVPDEFESGDGPRGDEFGSLAPGGRMWIAVAYRVTDCAAIVQAAPGLVPIQVARPWGTYTHWHQSTTPGADMAESGDGRGAVPRSPASQLC